MNSTAHRSSLYTINLACFHFRASLEEDSAKKKEWIHQQKTTISLDEYTSDLNCHIDAKSMSISPFSDSHFALMHAGVKCTHGFIKGKIR